MADGKSDKASAELRKLQQVQEGKKAMLDYEAEAVALRAKTEKLRALRLAREAEMPPAPAKPAKSAKSVKKVGKASKSKSKPRPLSDWLSDQRKDGRSD